MNRELRRAVPIAAAVACCGAPAIAQDAPQPSLSIDPIVARSLLAPIEEARGQAHAYRLDPGLQPAAGQRARLSVEVGESTLYAITGRLNRQPGPPGPLDSGHAKALGLKPPDSGKVYGAGISRTIRGVNVSATYQYSKISAEQPADDSLARGEGPGKSHSLRGTMRIRFRP